LFPDNWESDMEFVEATAAIVLEQFEFEYQDVVDAILSRRQ